MSAQSYYIAHDIPGRLRVIIPALWDKQQHEEIENMFSSLSGIKAVKVVSVIQSMTVEYDHSVIKRNTILRYLNIFFQQSGYDPLDQVLMQVKPHIRKDLIRSLVTGVILLVAYTRKIANPTPHVLDYAALISTAYTVLNHGKKRLQHPDVLTGIVSMLSLGAQNMLHVSMVTWAVNVLEIFNEITRSRNTSFYMQTAN
ncbi:HMA2 domain-containing protein [Bacillus taeanensis]|uniref:HMA domain-containing protein n=1 Tax=Bacillus taeanensis TaxID=273032 RepID=A0A366XT82_9BACI|nr:hypothetical protein [Bacillus taeanensis]RBW68758.1 hypothetical protein DS031_14525 [Bacillus taeanensis]